MTEYTVSMFKKSGKWYSDLETIEAPAHSMYIDVAKYIREKYKNDLQEGYMFLVKDTSSDLQHIFYQDLVSFLLLSAAGEAR